MDMHGTTLLGETGHFHHTRALAVEVRRHGKHRADGHNARATNSGDDNVMGAVDRRQDRHRQFGQVDFCRCFLADLRAFNRHKGRAEPFDAGEILVAG